MFVTTSTLIILGQKHYSKVIAINPQWLKVESTTLSPKIKLLNQIANDIASKHDTNSNYVVKIAIDVCFALLEMTHLANKKTYPDVNLLELR